MNFWIPALAVTSILLCDANCSNLPEVQIGQGVVKGYYKNTIRNRQITCFEGIPYAKPPTGKHRFKVPVPFGLWYGTLNATREPPHCLQYNFFTHPPVISGSEDCLYINVYTPQLPTFTNHKKLFDVIVYIHGGAFMMGKSTFHGPSILLDRDLVLVTFNYRLGPLGFLSTEDDVVPGNNGLKDQVLALKWVQENIKAFGGNPKSVTLAGLSAGSASCHFHMLSPLSIGLFKRAILLSGLALNPWAVVENSKEKAQLIANELGCPTNDSFFMIKCLRNRPAFHIVGLSQKLLYWNTNPSVPFGPVIEPINPDAFISEQPIDIIMKKEALDVPTLISFTSDEGLVIAKDIVVNPDMFNDLLNRWDELMPHVLEYNYTAPSGLKVEINQKIKEFYGIDNSTEGRNNLVKMFGDRGFMAGINKLAKTASMYNSSMYIYKFSYRGNYSFTAFSSNENLGVCHGDDILYTLGHMGFESITSESDLQVSEQILDLWVSFAANGTLKENWKPVNKYLPKIAFTEMKGPNDIQLTVVDELGEETFWDAFGLNENIVSPVHIKDEL